MPQISIEIPLTWGNHLEEQMEAIRNQTFQDYKISIASSLSYGECNDILRNYDAKVVQSGPNILEKRYEAHNISSGEFSLLLDETRIPEKDLLQRLSYNQSDMVVIREFDIGNSFWIELANLDKINILECNKIDMSSGFILPRYLKFKLLSESFNKIKENLQSEIFRSVLMEDHQLISFEATKLTKSISVLEKSFLKHYGDETLTSIVKKYHRYGKYHRLLGGTVYDDISSPRNRIRKICIGGRIKLYTLYLARGIPFLIGYYLF